MTSACSCWSVPSLCHRHAVIALQTMTVVVRDVRSVHVTNEQLLVLLGYVEQDLNDHTRQATAFGLLRVGGATEPRPTPPHTHALCPLGEVLYQLT